MTFASNAAYAASRISSSRKGRTKQFGWLQASATRNYSAPIGSENPATIRIDSRPAQHLDVASRRRSPMQAMTSCTPTYQDLGILFWPLVVVAMQVREWLGRECGCPEIRTGCELRQEKRESRRRRDA
jgi:hypothetical protein